MMWMIHFHEYPPEQDTILLKGLVLTMLLRLLVLLMVMMRAVS